MPLPVQTNGEKDDPASKEAERFESFYQGILELHEVLERVENFTVRRRMREIISRIEDDFVNCPEFTHPRSSPLKELRLGLAGGSLSGKSSLVHRYLTGFCPRDEVLSGRHKKSISIDGQKYLLLVRDETGPPDAQFSRWLDAILLVFSYADELSFNVISSYYAKMGMNRNSSLPVILVGIKDGITNETPSMINNARIKKFIADHNNCPFFLASLETGECVKEIFQTAAEMIVRSKSNPSLLSIGNDGLSSPAPNSIGASFETLTSSNYGSTLSITSQGSMKKPKKKGVFSKGEKKEEMPDDFGSGRTIPTKQKTDRAIFQNTIVDEGLPYGVVRNPVSRNEAFTKMKQKMREKQLIMKMQGYLYKRSHNSLKEWKKKYVTICDNASLVYYANMKDYIEEINGKAINLAHTTVKIPGKRPPKVNAQAPSKPPAVEIRNGETPKKQQQSKRNSMHKETLDAVIISNSLADSPTKQANSSPPNVDNALVKASKGIISTGIHGTPNNATSPTKKKNRRHGGRHAKSCEIDYGQICSDMEMSQGTPLSARRRFTHKRNKSGASKDLQFDKGTDTEDDDMVFTIISLDGKSWDFESTTPDERDRWVDTIEKQILKAFQTGISSPKHERCESDSSVYSVNSIKSSLRTIAGNDRCADCGSPDPEWASINLGILICIECSGVHRNLGTHLSRVRSVDLDDWPPESVAIMSIIGNEYANGLWENSLHGKKKPHPRSTREEREEWIDLKYKKKEFLQPFTKTSQSLGQRIIEAVSKDDRRSCYPLLIHSTDHDINTRTSDNQKMTPLHISCKLGNSVLVQLLLWYFGDPRALDANGHTPMMYAHQAQSKECAELLTQFGCPEDTPC